MRHEKLTPVQQMMLKGLTLDQKVQQAQAWCADGIISRALLEELTNRWHTKASRKTMGLQTERFSRTRTCIQGEIRSFGDLLKSRLNKWLADRSKYICLSTAELLMFKKYISYSHMHRKDVNVLVILGLRYPDESLNKICEDFIKTYRKNQMSNYDFWFAVWADAHIVPMNAVRLMVDPKTGEIDPCFDKDLIMMLIPKIKQQRDKEAQRLAWAESLQDEKSIARKKRRLQGFDNLLESARRYVV